MQPTQTATKSLPTTYLVLAAKCGEVHRFERPTPAAALVTRRRLAALGYAVSVLAAGSWA